MLAKQTRVNVNRVLVKEKNMTVDNLSLKCNHVFAMIYFSGENLEPVIFGLPEPILFFHRIPPITTDIFIYIFIFKPTLHI